MRRAGRWITFVALCSALAACAVDVIRLDEAARAKAHLEVRYWESSQLTRSYRTIQPIRATSCKRTWDDPPASQEDAIDQLRVKAAQLGANGITNLICDNLEFSLSKNCWSAITCRASAVEVQP